MITERPPVLGIVVPDLFHASVTFFHAHIASIHPGRTVVVHLSSTGEPARTDVPVIEVVSARPWREPKLPLLEKVMRQVNTWRANRLSRIQRTQVESFLTAHGVTHLFAEFATSGAVIAPVAKKMGLPLTVMSHGWDINVVGSMPQWRLRYRSLFASDAQLVAVCAFLRQRMARVGARVERVKIVPCAVNASAFRPTNHARSGPVRVVMVSRLIDQKGPMYSLEAFARAAAQRDDLVLDIVGNGPLMSELKRAIERAGVENKVRVHGDLEHSETLNVMSQSHIFIQHCVSLPRQGIESQAISLLEAMGHGLVPIVSRHGGMADHVVDGLRGWLVEERDVNAMAARILEMADDSETRDRLGGAAREFVLREFGPETVYPTLRRLIGLCNNLERRSRTGP